MQKQTYESFLIGGRKAVLAENISCPDDFLTRSVVMSIKAHKRESLMDVKPGDKLISRCVCVCVSG